MKRAVVLLMAVVGGAIHAANNAPLSAVWNIAPSGSATSNGELLFRMTPADGGDPVEVNVPVTSGTNEVGVARDIRNALSMQLPRDRFNVQLGAGANVLISDPRGQPNFSLELIDSNVADLRVMVQNVEPAASPTVPKQAEPATPPSSAPGTNPNVPGNALPPAGTPVSSSAPAVPDARAPVTTPTRPSQPAVSAPPNAAPLPEAAPPPNAAGGAGQPAAAPPDSNPGGSVAGPPPT